MKSSVPVFTKENPFPPASKVRRAHYHPSTSQLLSQKETKTALSPVCLNQRSRTQLHTLNRESQQMSKKHDTFPSTYGQPEPSTTKQDLHLFRNAASSDMEEPKQSARQVKSSVSSVLGVQEDSVLAKYVERFRHGQPQSREERQQMASANGEEQVPFWWMSHSSNTCSTPTKIKDDDVIQLLKEDQDSGQRQHNRSPSPCKESHSLLSDTSQGEFDLEVLHLQEEASKLLLRGECSVSDGSVPVSSEGIGCSDFSSPVSEDEPLQRPLIPSLIKDTTSIIKNPIAKPSSDSAHAVSSQKYVIPSLVPHARPEEDILFQWRLRRKMEQAREWPQSVKTSSLHMFSWQAPRLSHSSASEQAYKDTQPPLFSRDTHPNITAPQPENTEAHRLWPPAPNPSPFPPVVVSGAVSHLQSVSPVPAHMHLLCDVLPCPIQPSHPKAHQSISQRLNESQTRVVHKKTQVPERSTDNFRDLPLCEHVSLSPPASSGAMERVCPNHQKMSERNKKNKAETKESEKNGKEEAVPIRQQKKTTRSSALQRLPKKVAPCKEQQPLDRSQDFPSKSCVGDHEPLSSPIHSALGQVVSEVLFSTVDSSSAQRIPVSSASPPFTVSPSPQSPVPLSNAQNAMEVISQLLQEAEDSDEKEFEDDPLLQVLRKQRKWVKEQISEVDSILNEFLQEEDVT